jgi:hypothetical protein
MSKEDKYLIVQRELFVWLCLFCQNRPLDSPYLRLGHIGSRQVVRLPILVRHVAWHGLVGVSRCLRSTLYSVLDRR